VRITTVEAASEADLEAAARDSAKDLKNVEKRHLKKGEKGSEAEAVGLEGDLEGAVRSSESVWKKGTKCLKREEKASGAEVDMVVASGNLLVRDSRSVGRNSAVEDSEADTKSLLERNMVVVVSAMKADGARGRGSRRSTEKRLLRSEKRSVRKNTERKDVRRVVVDGSTELVEAM
jgi:hypothetical protein